MSISPVELFVAISANWRFSSLVANEDGPFLMFKRLRAYAKRLTEKSRFWGSFRLYEGLTCEWCNSIWIAIPLAAAWYFIGDVVVWLLLPFAMSTWVIVLKYIIQPMQQFQKIVDAKVEEQEIKQKGVVPVEEYDLRWAERNEDEYQQKSLYCIG